MATIPNNITNSTQVQFQICPLKTNLGTPAAGSIVFIKDTNELYLDGTYYGLSAADAAELKTATANIKTLTSGVSDLTNVTGLLTTYVTNLRKFADGETEITREGPVLETSEGVLAGITNVKAAIKKLDEVVTTLNAHVWTAVTKPGNAGQFATSVTQEIDGSIKVDYADVKSTDVKRDANQNGIGGATVEAALDTLKVKAEAAQATANQNASDITVIKGPEDQEGSIANAVKKAKDALIDDKGSSVWGPGEKKTLTQLRKLISTLQGIDDGTAERLEAIVKELQDAGANGEFAGTLLDKFLQLYGTPTDGNFIVNEKNVKKLQEIILEIENEIGEKIGGAINGLNNTVRDNLTLTEEGNKKAVTVGHVGIEVVEEKGKLLSVDIVENDIASANELSTLKTEVSGIKTTVEKHEGQLTWQVIS